MTLLGLVLALVPLALWVAWSEIVLLMVVVIGAASAILLGILSDYRRLADDEPAGRATRETLPEDFAAEVHRIFPLTYHHSRKPSARFRETMEKLRQMMKRTHNSEKLLIFLLFV
jgi:hypothetical protein